MKRRKQPQREERRKGQVEVNLLAETDAGGTGLTRARRGCALPFMGGSAILLVAFEALRAGLG